MKLTLSILFTIFYSVLLGQNQGVKTKTETRFNEHKQKVQLIVEEFNSEGLGIKRSILNVDGSVRTYSMTSFLPNNLQESLHHNSKDELTEEWRETTDDRGNITSVTYRFDPTADWHHELRTYDYDNKDNLTTVCRLDLDSTINWEYTYEFNEDGQEVYSLWKFKGTLREETVNTYKKGLLKSTTKYLYEDAKKKLFSEAFYKYSKQGMLQEESIKTMHLTTDKTTTYYYMYDENGRLISKTAKHGKTLYYIHEFEYELY